jgi:hypothetical protein
MLSLMQENAQPVIAPVIREIVEWRNEWKGVHDPPPSQVFHYTDACALKSIVSNGELWASHVDYVNDSQEFRYARVFIDAAFERHIEQSAPDIAAKVEKIREVYRTHSFLWQSVADVYIACFCEEGDLLSQWRAYASRGQGFALGFDPRRLMTVVATNPELGRSTKFFRVIYDLAQQQRWVDLAIGKLIAALRVNSETNVLNQVPLVFSEMAFAFKHPSFQEEKEWRLVCAASPALQDIIDVRESRGQLLPYAAISIAKPASLHSYISVVHGPTVEAENTKKALRMIFGKALPSSWSEIAVSGSNAPLRGV